MNGAKLRQVNTEFSVLCGTDNRIYFSVFISLYPVSNNNVLVNVRVLTPIADRGALSLITSANTAPPAFTVALWIFRPCGLSLRM